MGQRRYVEPIAKKVEKLKRGQELDARTASLQFANRLMKRMAQFAIGGEENEDGDEVGEDGKVIKQMSAAQIRAAEAVLRKILPDLSSVQELPVDDFANMSREEMLNLLGSLVSGNPQLLSNPDIQSAVNKSQTVIELKSKNADS